eukprot:CAMPEP_0203956088 /NCGR_PEP_ID=MMETSP0359-20131031/88486_1 /ASSEMBLY_ACC=CAM_ASM_000338 /TAXON_ID=268821 /ORGANISM="Scrippsiella Hangoei, Strain SHTV-5" /LENGTH=73 /DNA_ID=CAMNT_0050889781 /DNA_START=223 /DNA_END=444 /DNA_ORIENTATION=+
MSNNGGNQRKSFITGCASKLYEPTTSLNQLRPIRDMAADLKETGCPASFCSRQWQPEWPPPRACCSGSSRAGA